MSDKNKSIEARKCITPRARASYANVFVPTAIKADQEKKYNITFLFDKDEDLSAMKKAVNAAAREAWGDDKDKWPKKRRMPFRDGTKDKPDNKEYKGKIFVYASSKEPPGIVGPNGKTKITQESGAFYSGCYCRAELIAFAYKNAGNVGVSFALQNLQKLDDGDRLSGKKDASEVFGSVEEEDDEDYDLEVGDDDESEDDED